jgi:hypothetical protein
MDRAAVTASSTYFLVQAGMDLAATALILLALRHLLGTPRLSVRAGCAAVAGVLIGLAWALQPLGLLYCPLTMPARTIAGVLLSLLVATMDGQIRITDRLLAGVAPSRRHE